MVYKILLLCLISISSLFSSVSASTNLENLKSFKADFIQKITNESNTVIEYKGEVFIKNNGRVLWRYNTPILKNVYIINNIVIVDEPELEQAIYSTLEDNIDMIKLLKDARKIEKNKYETKLYNTLYTITTKENKIKSMFYKDELENKILISFENVKQDIEIKDEIFNFLAPEYYDIIKK